ncbi:MAG: polysaccharide deacetylase [Bdellovibrionaceae bacterium]|nr:polysaccharide deacetylase [Pseudobdellovibrionaceae bacterium]|tara:strand:- start:14036 stop:15223 length:1188 start_codon:yes stop_codon:yes gene_type:complete
MSQIIRWIVGTLIVISIASCAGFSKKESAERNPSSLVERPPQFVLLAFDGSKSLNMWENTRAFAKVANAKFTYFISGVYFLESSVRSEYKGPGHKRGRSDIGFGNDLEDVRERLQQIMLAVKEGNEIGSHANGHFNGSKWSQHQWETEFVQFDQFLVGAWQRAGLEEPREWFDISTFKRVGFRAPLLGYSKGLWPALKNFNFKYDTSRVSSPDYWPHIRDGVWNFPLASIRRYGTKYSTLSMDYNFYYSHSKGKRGEPSDFADYREEMYKSYLQYFKTNYLGNRAPVHIGHHFSTWNGGAYYAALKDFANTVCSLPETRCVTYTELMNFLEDHQDEIKSYQAGKFKKINPEVAYQYFPKDVQNISFDSGEIDDSQVNEFMKAMRDGKINPHPEED